MFKIISDAACDFTAAQAREHGVDTVPFYVTEENGMKKTSQPNPQDYVDALTPYLVKGEDILLLTISSKLSGSYNSAVLAAEMLAEDYPGRTVTVLDSLSGSVGQGLILREIIDMRDNGFSLRDTARLAAEVIKSTRVYFTVESLDHLRRGGRINFTKAFVGGILGLRPVLHIIDGAVLPLATVRGKRNIFDLIGKKSSSDIKTDKGDYRFSVGHVQNETDALALNVSLSGGWGIAVLNPSVVVGAVISTHTGPGALAFAYCKKYSACAAIPLEEAA
ncbi:MAG: DegV family protein [Defluviitaleaceae bacterium]|nr:DegV family protein [Defluviitaleaceae bacterium]